MTAQVDEHQKGFIAFVERIGRRIPDPVIIFIYFLIGALLLTAHHGSRA